MFDRVLPTAADTAASQRGEREPARVARPAALTVGAADDRLELEADRVADEVIARLLASPPGRSAGGAHQVRHDTPRIRRSGITITKDGEPTIRRGRKKNGTGQGGGGTTTTLSQKTEKPADQGVTDEVSEDVDEEPATGTEAESSAAWGIVSGLGGLVTGLMGWWSGPSTATPATGSANSRAQQATADAPKPAKQRVDARRPIDQQGGSARENGEAKKPVATVDTKQPKMAQSGAPTATQPAEDPVALKAAAAKAAADANTAKMKAEAQLRKQQEKDRAAAKALRIQQEKEAAAAKQEAERAKKAQEMAAAEADFSRRSAGIVAEAKQARADAQARNMDVGNIQDLIVKITNPKGKNPDWLGIRAMLDELATRTAALKENIAQRDTANQQTYLTEAATILPAANSAVTRATTHRIDVSKLTDLLQTHANQLKTAQPHVLLKTLGSIKSATAVVVHEDDAAIEHDTTSPSVLADATAAKAEGEEALASTPANPASSKYWKHLQKALEELAQHVEYHDKQVAVEQPDWFRLTERLGLIQNACMWVRREITVAPARTEGRVGQSRYTPAIDKTSVSALRGDHEDDEIDSVEETLDAIAGTNTTWRGGDGGKWGAYYGNADGSLPAGHYKEYYVRPPAGTNNYGGRRVVVGDDGRRWYTWTHYGDNGEPAFVLLDTQ